MKSSETQSSFGDTIRSYREKSGHTLKEISEIIEIDISLLAKIERDERQPSKEALNQLAKVYDIDEKMLQSILLSDQIASKIIEESADIKVLKLAEKKVEFFKSKQDEEDKGC